MSKVFLFASRLAFIIAIIFGIHIGLLYWFKHPVFSNLVIQAYLVNYLMALIIYSIIFKLRLKFGHITGFMFMIGSFLKFIIFFLVFYPAYKFDGNITKFEFAAFFTPYLVCLIFETLSLAKILNVKHL